MQQDRDAAGGGAVAVAVAAVEASVDVGVSFRTEFLASELQSCDFSSLDCVFCVFSSFLKSFAFFGVPCCRSYLGLY